MEKLIIANWKANLSLAQTQKWLNEVREQYQPVPGLRVILAVPFPFLSDLEKSCRSLPWIALAAQDVSSFPLGNYTGSVPAAWLNSYVEYAIIGHNERRKYFHETIQDVANKVSEALEEDIRPILCVDKDVARQQAASIDFNDMEKITVACTPSKLERPDISRNTSAVIESIEKVAKLFPGSPVLYGGGVNDGNIRELFTIDTLSGAMVGGGCLDPKGFIRLLANAAETIA